MSGVLQVQNENQLEDLAVLNLKPENNGYLYVYVSNESAHDVNFNNLVVQQHYGRVLEENHYYPYGLLIKPLSFASTSMPLQGYKFNGKELETDLDLGWYHYGFREYDPVIGRWWVADPFVESYTSITPFRYGFNNPARFKDIGGYLESENDDIITVDENGRELMRVETDDDFDVIIHVERDDASGAYVELYHEFVDHNEGLEEFESDIREIAESEAFEVAASMADMCEEAFKAAAEEGSSVLKPAAKILGGVGGAFTLAKIAPDAIDLKNAWESGDRERMIDAAENLAIDAIEIAAEMGANAFVPGSGVILDMSYDQIEDALGIER